MAKKIKYPPPGTPIETFHPSIRKVRDERRGYNRRDFNRLALGGVAALLTFGFRSREKLPPARVRLGWLDLSDFTERNLSAKPRQWSEGWRAKDVRQVGEDLTGIINGSSPRPDALIMGADEIQLPRPQDQGPTCCLTPDLKLDRSSLQRTPLELRGFRVLNGASLTDPALLEAARREPRPAVVLLDRRQWFHRATTSEQILLDHVASLIDSFPQAVLVLLAGSRANRVRLLPGGQALMVATASPFFYPCGARVLDLEVEPDGQVTVTSRFLQSRHLDLVEESYARSEGDVLERVGRREDRSFTAAEDKVLPVVAPLNPNFAPWWRDQSRLNLAVMSDFHLCLDRFLPGKNERWKDFAGSFKEEGSIALIEDVLDQVAAGRHRVEFYDRVFQQDPQADRHYLEIPVDGLILTGDYADHGRRAEAEAMLTRLEGLPESIKRHAMMVPGNHDFYSEDFAPDGVISDRHRFTDLYRDFFPQPGKTDYVVHLDDWLSVIMLDTIIPWHSGIGVIQERIDWLEDMLDQLRCRMVLVVSHHPIYPHSLIPDLLEALQRPHNYADYKHGAVNDQLMALLARFPNVKVAVSGHLHAVIVDRFPKDLPCGNAPDDSYTTRLQVPSVVDYPCGYRLFKIKRTKDRARIKYITAYTRRFDLRDESHRAPLFRLFGTELEVPRDYAGIIDQLRREDNILGPAARLDRKELIDLNLRGMVDGTARAGKGFGGKPNINGKIEVSLSPPSAD